MSENINTTSRVDGPDKRCPEEKLYGKPLRKQLLPFLMPGHRTRGLDPKWAGKADPCFYLNGGNDHASDCDKAMLESEIASYTTNATYAYRRAPFVGQQVTFGNRAFRAPSSPPAATWMGGSGTGGMVGQSGESDAVTAPSPPPAESSAGRGDVGVLQGHPGRGGGIGGASPFLHYRRSHDRRKRGSTIGEGGDTTISSPGRSPKQPLPGIGLHVHLHGRQACPEFITFDQGFGQICPR